MSTLIVSYSLTGNNALMAEHLANELEADIDYLQESKKRNTLTIVLDVLFNRTPTVKPLHKNPGHYSQVLFVAPIWLGKVASPFRSLLKAQKGKNKSYAFVSISAGADGENRGIGTDLEKYSGNKPTKVVNLLIKDLMTGVEKPSRKELDAFRLTPSQAADLAKVVAKQFSCKDQKNKAS